MGKELHLENDLEVGKTNGFSNGSHEDEQDEEAMGTDDVKSPPPSKGKAGRRSKSNGDSKSRPFFFFLIMQSWVLKNQCVKI